MTGLHDFVAPGQQTRVISGAPRVIVTAILAPAMFVAALVVSLNAPSVGRA